MRLGDTNGKEASPERALDSSSARFSGVEAAHPADTGQCWGISDPHSTFQDRFKGRRSPAPLTSRTILSITGAQFERSEAVLREKPLDITPKLE